MPGTSFSALIVRLDAIGDALALTPLVAELRKRVQRLDIVLRPQNFEIFSNEAFDRKTIATFALRDGSQDALMAISALGEELAHAKYDAVLVATEDAAGYRLAKASRARRRIGFDNGWGKPLKTLWIRRHCTQTVYRTAGLDPAAPHECDVLLKLARALFEDIEATRDASALRPLILDEHPHADARVVLQITDRWERFGVSIADLAQLARALAPNHTLRFVCAQNEAHYAANFTAASSFGVEIFSSLVPWKSAIASARAVVAPDSGAVQLAGMIGVPVVALYPAANFALQTARWSPWAGPYRALSLEGAWIPKTTQALEELLTSTAYIA